MPDMGNANPEVSHDPMVDAASSASSGADIKLEPGTSGVPPHPSQAEAVLPQDALESTFQVTVPPPKQRLPQYPQQNYEIRLMLLEQQNKKRLMMAKQEQAAMGLPQQEGGCPNPLVHFPQTEPSLPHSTLRSSSQITGPPSKRVEDMTPQEKIGHFEAEHESIAQRSKQLREAIATEGHPENYQIQLMLLENMGKMRLLMVKKKQAFKELRESFGNPNSSVPHYQRSMFDHHNQKKATLEQAEGWRQQNIKPSSCDSSASSGERPAPTASASAPSSITAQVQAPLPLHQQAQTIKYQGSQKPQFPLDWEAQAKSHLGFAPNATLNPADQVKLDAIIKQKYEQVWGIQEKQGDGQNNAVPPIIKTYQEQLRAQALIRQKQQMAQQAQMMTAHTYQMSGVRADCQLGMTAQEQATTRSPNIQDRHFQVNLLEERNRKRPAASKVEQSSAGERKLQDYQMQMMLLEQQNKKRLMMARQEQDEPRVRKRVMVAPLEEPQKFCG